MAALHEPTLQVVASTQPDDLPDQSFGSALTLHAGVSTP